MGMEEGMSMAGGGLLEAECSARWYAIGRVCILPVAVYFVLEIWHQGSVAKRYFQRIFGKNVV